MENNPILFINSVDLIKEGMENQSLYDSRKQKKNILKHRFDDINAMIEHNIKCICEVKIENTLIEGVVLSIKENYLEMNLDNEKVLIDITKIEYINIINL